MLNFIHIGRQNIVIAGFPMAVLRYGPILMLYL